MSKTRSDLLTILTENHGPYSIQHLITLLPRRTKPAHFTTIYREINLLLKEGFVTELQFGDNKKVYEIAHQDHHRHLICVSCSEIQEIILENDLDIQEKIIQKTRKFKVLNHSLEFFGVCHSCSTT